MRTSLRRAKKTMTDYGPAVFGTHPATGCHFCTIETPHGRITQWAPRWSPRKEALLRALAYYEEHFLFVAQRPAA